MIIDNLQCLSCDSKFMEIKEVVSNVEHEGTTYSIISPAYVCAFCNNHIMTSLQMNLLREKLNKMAVLREKIMKVK